ncbi:HLA class II histocompatibility antigen, DR alpha chain [Heliangelus exortis]|uniref:HLA class II histocompatibility antigen, DR alpha chain n=1 Tax=Heliangelus exortis TaxID=472823 RepID=UPI003A951572
MAAGRGVPLVLLAVLVLRGVGGIKVEHKLIQVDFYQRDERRGEEGGQFMFDFDGDEIFHVDLEKQETVWRLPEFGTFANFEAQGALQNMDVMKQNLEIMMKRSNGSHGTSVPPVVRVFPKHRVELEEPNVLICFVENFWPPVISISWLRNGEEVREGVFETVFYPREDNTFRKFSYLTFIPTRGDFYDCRVEHEGLPHAETKHWDPQVPSPPSQATETVVCGLGLAVGIVGIVGGTILIIKASKMSGPRTHRDPL